MFCFLLLKNVAVASVHGLDKACVQLHVQAYIAFANTVLSYIHAVNLMGES